MATDAICTEDQTPIQNGGAIEKKPIDDVHEYLRKNVDPILMPLIEALLLYQPESIYDFIYDYVDESKSARFTDEKVSLNQHAKNAKRLKMVNRRRMVDFMSTSVIPVMDDLAHQILKERPNLVRQFIQDVAYSRKIIGSKSTSSAIDTNQFNQYRYKLHERVWARYRGHPRFLMAVITCINPAESEDETYDVQYDEDGKTEKRVHRLYLMPFKTCTSSGSKATEECTSNQSIGDNAEKTNQDVSTLPDVATQIEPEIEICTVILVLGIDGAGKTTLLSTLQGELDKDHVPSAGFSSTTFQIENGTATFYDLGGGPTFRNAWKEYYADAHGIIFVIDSSDSKLVQQSAKVLDDILVNPMLKDKPLLLLANKQDIESALSENELIQSFSVMNNATDNARLVSCIIKPSKNNHLVDDRIEHALQWLLDQVKGSYKVLDDRVRKDKHLKKHEDEERRANQRIRVNRWKEEKEQTEMMRHDTVQMLATESESTADTTSSLQNQIMCSECTIREAVTKCKASKWMPVCDKCMLDL